MFVIFEFILIKSKYLRLSTYIIIAYNRFFAVFTGKNGKQGNFLFYVE